MPTTVASAPASRSNNQSMSVSAFPPSHFDREFINNFLNSPLADHEDVCDIRPGDVRPIPGLDNRDLYATAARVAEIFYHPNAYDLGTPPEFRSESNQPLEPAAALILAQVAAAAEATTNTHHEAYTLASRIHAAWVHTWLAVRDQLPMRASENRFVKSWFNITDRAKLREAIFIKLAYQIVSKEPGADIAVTADLCMELAEYILNIYRPSTP